MRMKQSTHKKGCQLSEIWSKSKLNRKPEEIIRGETRSANQKKGSKNNAGIKKNPKAVTRNIKRNVETGEYMVRDTKKNFL